MLKRSIFCLTGVILVLAFGLFTGCGDDTSTPTGGLITGANQLSELISLVQEVAPPLYDGPGFSGSPSLSPMPADSFWLEGETPWIGKAFGDKWPMALYTNIRRIDSNIVLLNFALENGEGTHNRVVGTDTTSVTVTYSELADPTVVPVGLQTVLGATTVSLQNYVRIVEGETVIDAAFSVSDTENSLMIYHSLPADAEAEIGRETRVFYADLNLTTGIINLAGGNYREMEVGLFYGSAFKFGNDADNNFDFRMSYLVENQTYSFSMVECLIGGGHKDDGFAIRHAMFIPADGPLSENNEVVSVFSAPNYTYGGTEVSDGLAPYVADANLFDVNDLPSTWFSNPWE